MEMNSLIEEMPDYGVVLLLYSDFVDEWEIGYRVHLSRRVYVDIDEWRRFNNATLIKWLPTHWLVLERPRQKEGMRIQQVTTKPV